MRAVLITILFFFAGTSLAQDPVISLNIVTKDDDSGKKLSGATVVVKSGGAVFVTKQSASNGKVPPIDLPIGQNYEVIIKKDGYVSKIATIDGHFDYPEDLPPFVPFPIQTSLFKKVEGIDFGFLETTPMIKFELDQYGMQTWDQGYTKQMLKKIADLKDKADDLKEELAQKQKDFDAFVDAGDKDFGKEEYQSSIDNYEKALAIFADKPDVKKKLEDAKKKLAEQNEAAEAEKKFQEIMAKAKDEYSAKNLEKALELYKEATKLKPGEQLPKDRIAEIEKELKDMADQEAKFAKFVADGDAAMGKEDYDNAITNFEGALGIKEDAGVKTKLENAKKKKEEKENAEAAAKELEENYNNLITEADKLFDGEDYEASKSKYEEALKLKPNESHPAARISEIDDILKKQKENEEAAKKLEQDYKTAIDAGDAAMGSEDWDAAISKYEEALKLKPDESYPKDQISKAKEKKDKDAAEKELNEKYDKLITDAEGLKDGKKYEEAIGKYQQASALKPDEQKPKDEIAAIQKIIGDLANAKELEEKYNQLMADGKDLQGKDQLQDALAKYEEALKTKPGDTDAQSKIDAVKKLIAEKEAAQAEEEKFNDLVAEGDKALGDKAYEDAKSSYQEALKIKDDQGVKDKITEIDKILKEQSEAADLEKKFEAAIKKADEAFNAEKWEDALASYEEALTYKEDPHPTARIVDVKKKLDELAAEAEQEKKFNDLVAEGDRLGGSKEYDDAIAKYQEALKIHPDQTVSQKIVDLKEQKKADEANKEQIENYKAKIQEADAAFDDKNWDGATALYEEALGIKGDESYPTDQINKIKELKEKEAADAADAEYQAVIKEADGYRDQDNFDAAIKKYEEAKKMKPSDAYPQEQIDKMKEIIKQREAEEADKEAFEKKYKDLIVEADDLFDGKDHKSALEKYKEALTMKPNDSHPKERLKAIEEILAKENADAEKDAKYQAAIDKADKLFGDESWKEAKTAYQDALDIKSGEAYPKTQIAACDTKMQEESVSEEEEQYQKIIEAAQKKLDEKDYEKAIDYYERALTMKPDDQFPKDQISKIKQLIEDQKNQAAQKEIDEKYQAAIDKADKLFGDESWKEAKTAYQDALDIKSGEAYPKTQIAACDTKMQSESVSEEEEQYQKIIEAAQKKLDEKDYEKAIDYYERALTMKPDDQFPKDQISKIKQLIEDQKNQAAQKEIDEKYQAAIDKADKLFGDESWKEAKTAYQDALDIKSGEAYPKTQIAACDEKMQSESVSEEEEQYQKILAAAQKKFDEKDYEKAIDYYERALTMKPDDQFPKDQITKIKQLIADQKDQAAQKAIDQKYQAAIDKADELYGQKSWKEAKKAYESALEIKASEQYPKDQITACNENMKAEVEGEVEAQYQKILEVAQKKFDEKDYKKSLELYKRANGLRPSDQLPKDRINEINQILRDMMDEKAKRDQYNKIVQDADNLFEKNNWRKAKKRYYDALDVLPNEQWPKDQIEKCNTGIEEEGRTADQAYQKLIKKADEYFDAENWEKAKGLYKRALNIKPSDSYPKQRLAEIDKILNPPAEIYGVNATLKDYGPATNEEAIDMEAMLLEAKEQANEFEIQKIYQQRDDADDALTEWNQESEESMHKTKYAVDQIEENLDEVKWSGELGRQEARNSVDIWTLEINEKHKEYVVAQENQIQFQNRKVEAIKIEIDENNYDNDVPRQEYLEDVDKIKVDNNNTIGQNQRDQTDENWEANEEIIKIVESHVVNDANNDVARKNQEVKVEDMQIRIINKRNADAWAQEDENYKTRDEAEELIDDIHANNLEKDIPRKDNILVVEEWNEKIQEKQKEDVVNQEDVIMGNDKFIENMEIEIEENQMDNDKPRQETELIVEEKEIELNKVEGDRSTDQYDVTFKNDKFIEEMEIEIEENQMDNDKPRQETELIVEEKEIELNKVEGDRSTDQYDVTFKNDKFIEEMEIEIEENQMDNDKPRQETELIVEEKEIELNKVEGDRSTDQYDVTFKNDKFIEEMEIEIEENQMDNDKPRQETELIVEEKEIEINKRDGELADDQTNSIMDKKVEITKIEDDIEAHKAEMGADREGYEKVLVDVDDEINDYNGDLSKKNEDNGMDTKDHTEQMVDDKADFDKKMNEKADEHYDSTLDEVEEYKEHIGEASDGSEEARNSSEDYVEELKTLKDINLDEMTPEMENELGKKYPEGVTEESYQINDNNGLMKAYVVRKVVVKSGNGKVYEMIRTRYGGVTYTRNGQPISEYQYTDETSSAGLGRN